MRPTAARLSIVGPKLPLLARLLLVSLFVLAMKPCTAAACSCVMPGPPEEALESSSAAFVGTVADVAQANDNPNMLGGLRVTFDVQQTWKGPTTRQIAILTSESSASCGYTFQPGMTYLVYARDSEGFLYSGLCTRNAQIDQAGEDIAALGDANTALSDGMSGPAIGVTGSPAPSIAPSSAPVAAPVDTSGIGSAMMIAGGVGLALVIGLAGVLIWRRRG